VPVATNPAEKWYFGAAPDLLLGCGALYMLLFLAMAVFGDGFREFAPIGLLPLVVLVTGVPHYGATLVRICDRPEERHAYSFVAIGTSLVMIAALAVGLQSAVVGSWILTIYLTWSPWHYSGQNYGITLMFLRRREVDVSPTAKRWLYASFILSFGLTALSIHGVLPGASYAPIQYDDTLYRQYSLGIPEGIRWPLMVGIASGYAISLMAAFGHFLRSSSLRAVAPAMFVTASQGLWFALPAFARFAGWFQSSGPLALEYSTYLFAWVGIAHSVQYLWVTSYYAARSDGLDPRAANRTFLARYGLLVLAAGAALWVIPALVFAPGALGRIPFDAGLAVMIAATVNLHHFVLDGVIWKLRDARISRVLLRGGAVRAAPEAVAVAGAPRRSLAGLKAIAWAVGIACVAIHFIGTIEYEIGVRRALRDNDTDRAFAATEHLAWIGRDSAKARLVTGLARARAGDLAGGIDQLERGIALIETPDGWGGLGRLYEQDGRVDDAIEAYRRAQDLGPPTPELMNNLAWMLALHRSGHRESAEEAIELARRASEAFGDRNPSALDTLAVTLAASGRFGDAQKVALRAVRIASAAGDDATAAEIAGRLALYRADRPYVPEMPR
jgi:Flp pilus assembly protein TadD